MNPAVKMKQRATPFQIPFYATYSNAKKTNDLEAMQTFSLTPDHPNLPLAKCKYVGE